MKAEEFWEKAFLSACNGLMANSNPAIVDRAERIAQVSAIVADHALEEARKRGVFIKRRWWSK